MYIYIYYAVACVWRVCCCLHRWTPIYIHLFGLYSTLLFNCHVIRFSANAFGYDKYMRCSTYNNATMRMLSVTVECKSVCAHTQRRFVATHRYVCVSVCEYFRGSRRQLTTQCGRHAHKNIEFVSTVTVRLTNATRSVSKTSQKQTKRTISTCLCTHSSQSHSLACTVQTICQQSPNKNYNSVVVEHTHSKQQIKCQTLIYMCIHFPISHEHASASFVSNALIHVL